MTLDSITKELMKAWKTSTGLAISLLSATILFLSIATEVSLSDLAAFGIFFVALQALEFTKEQVNEWRRKDALIHCYEAERLYEKIKPIINEIIQAALGSKKAKENLFSKKLKKDYEIESHELENSEIINRLITETRMIDTHLAEMKKEPTQHLLGLLIHLDCAVHLADLHSLGCEEEESNHAEKALQEIKEAVEELGIRGRFGVNLILDSYIYELKFTVVEK